MKGLLERFRYKPGWKLEVIPTSMFAESAINACSIGMTFRAPNAESWNQDESNIIVLGRRVTISWDELHECTEEELVRTIGDQVKLFEMHEVDEWLRFDGVRLNDPHPELRSRT